MKQILSVALIFSLSFLFAQKSWKKGKIHANQTIKTHKQDLLKPKLYSVNLQELKSVLNSAPDRGTAISNTIVELPNFNGKMERYVVYRASNFHPDLAAQYPEINAYQGFSMDHPQDRIRFSVSHKSISAMRTSHNGQVQILEPYSTDNQLYAVHIREHSFKDDFECQTEHEVNSHDDNETIQDSFRNANDSTLRTFRTAIAVTGEYTQYHGGTVADAMAAINTTLTRINEVYELDLSITMQLIPNNTAVVYTSGGTDPFSAGGYNGQLQSVLSSVIGESNYDVGHLFASGQFNGNAGCIGCVCVNGQKGSAFTSGTPEGDRFDIDYAAHEYGHQFGGNHTFSRSEGTGANMEPGSGSTIMAYAGIMTPNVQQVSDPYFHFFNINQILNYVRTRSCQSDTSLANQAPTVDAGLDYLIPAGTPFRLTAVGSDPDGDAITYNWEQANASTSGSPYSATPNNTNGPNFRSLTATESPTRFFPNFESVKNGQLYPTFEMTTNVTRNFNFNVTVRDNIPGGGQTGMDNMVVNVIQTPAPFRVNSPILNQTVRSGQAFDVTWEVGGTDGAPINTANVNILLSRDDGATFTAVVNNTPNDGTETITLPMGSEAEEAFIMVEAVGNIYYSLSSKFLIDFERVLNCESFPLTIDDGNISDNAPSFSVGSVTLPNTTDFEFLDVKVDVTHTRISDLLVILQSPIGNQSALWDRNCGDQDNLVATFSDFGGSVDCNNSANSLSFLPNDPIGNITPNDIAGQWLLGVSDRALREEGTFNSASIEVCSATFRSLSTIDPNQNDLNITVYPNPSKGIFYVRGDLKSSTTYKLFNSAGKLAKQGTLNPINNQASIDLTSLPTGIYVLQMNIDGQSVNKKLIKQ